MLQGVNLAKLDFRTLISVALGLYDQYISGGKDLADARTEVYTRIAKMPAQAAANRQAQALNLEGQDGVRPAGMDLQEESEGAIP